MSSSEGKKDKRTGKRSKKSRRQGIHKTAQEPLDLGAILGAAKEAAQCFSIYLPNKDRNDEPIKNHSSWVGEARRLLARINGGSTAMPPTDGMWLNEETGQMIEENTVVVYSFIQPDPFEEHLPQIREFLHRFGGETNQGEVSCEFNGYFYRIMRFDNPGREMKK